MNRLFEIRFLLVLSVALFAAAACDRSQQSPPQNTSAPTSKTSDAPLPTVQMTLGSRTFTLEVADNPAAQQRGLMNRDSMPADHGMIFVFPREDTRNFWMKDTRIPLDIVYLSRTGKVVTIAQMKPLDESSVSSVYPAKYAIELNVGTARELGLRAGDLLHIPPACREPKR